MLLTFLLLIPFLTGILCWTLRERAVWERLNLLGFTIVAALAIWIGAKVLTEGAIEAFGGFLRVDALGALVLGLTAFVALVCAIYAVGYLREEQRVGKIDLRQLHHYYVLTPLFVAAMIAVPLVNNLGLLWIAIESNTVASVFLVAFYRQKSSLEAAWKYIIIGSAGIALALFGTVLVYYSAVPVLGDRAHGGFDWSLLMNVAAKCQPDAMRLGFVMILVGYGTKAGLAPMHTWKPDAYAEAPVPVACLLGAGFINCALYGIIRFEMLAAKCLGHQYTSNLLVIFGLLSILVAAPFVLIQRNFRRLLAYSSIDHAGIMVAAFGFGGKLGVLGMLLHMLFHGITKPLMFFCAGNVQQHFGTPYLRKVTGLIQTLPWTGGLFLLATLAITGVPPFSIFQSEFMSLSAALAADRAWAAALFVAGIVTIFAGFLMSMSRLVLGSAVQGATRSPECPWKMGAMVAVAVPVITFGWMLPSPLYHLLERAAQIIGGTQ